MIITTLRGPCHRMSLIIKNKNIYGSGVSICTVFLRYWVFYEVKGLGHTPGGPKVYVNECVLSNEIRNQYVWFRGGDPNGF